MSSDHECVSATKSFINTDTVKPQFVIMFFKCRMDQRFYRGPYFFGKSVTDLLECGVCDACVSDPAAPRLYLIALECFVFIHHTIKSDDKTRDAIRTHRIRGFIR